MLFSLLLPALSLSALAGASGPHAPSSSSASSHQRLAKRSKPSPDKRASETIDDADTSSITYTGSWTHSHLSDGSTLSYSSAAGDSFSFVAPKGATGVTIKSTLKDDRATFNVLKDGKVVGKGTEMSAASKADSASRVVWSGKITDGAKHTFKVVNTGAKGKYLSLDEIEIAGVSGSAGGGAGDVGSYFYGANNYYLYSMAESDRIQVLDAMQSAGMQVARIFLTHVGANSKGSNSIDVPDVESDVGVYDDTILESIDQLMVDASSRGIKLIIALHDRYALGFWGVDAYACKYGITCSGGDPQIADASPVYDSNDAAGFMDKRITHILQHKNAKMGNKAWAELSEAIFAFEPQNEPMGHMSLVKPEWVCDRAGTIKKLVGNSGIKVSSGGGIELSNSFDSWATDCANIDILSAHDYGTDASSSAATLKAAQDKYSAQGKIVLFEEWGQTGSDKANLVDQFVQALKGAGVPWLYWEVTNPGQGSNNFEVWTDEAAWQPLTQGGNAPSNSINNAVATTKSAKHSGKGKKQHASRTRRSQASRRNHH